jgi:spore coat protein U-like protein
MRSAGRGAALVLSILGFGPVSTASTATANFAVSVLVSATCSITTTPLNFASYSGLVDQATSILTLTCTNTTPYTVGLSAGNGTGATVTTRSMTAGAVALNYGMYRDAAYLNNWGMTAGTDTVAGTGNGNAQTLTVYGRIPAGQFVTPGAYSDTIVAAITY